ncbi:MAG: 5-formyltetrahydrofolate cyclo-ligase [Archangium sp.]|nr:5-formyltetrahydrofolate cyclo-ligase [Archangium sp.]
MVADEKRVLRRQLETTRDALVRADASHEAAARFPLERRPAVVAGTFPMRSELDPRPLMKRLEALGSTLALPRTPKKGQPLVFHRWSAETRLVTSRFGVTEPVPETLIVEPDLLLVPLLAFDATGARLGYGGGFYDVTLETLRRTRSVFAVGFAYAGQELPTLPTEPHDQRLDAVLTEREWRVFAR